MTTQQTLPDSTLCDYEIVTLLPGCGFHVNLTLPLNIPRFDVLFADLLLCPGVPFIFHSIEHSKLWIFNENGYRLESPKYLSRFSVPVTSADDNTGATRKIKLYITVFLNNALREVTKPLASTSSPVPVPIHPHHYSLHVNSDISWLSLKREMTYSSNHMEKMFKDLCEIALIPEETEPEHAAEVRIRVNEGVLKGEYESVEDIEVKMYLLSAELKKAVRNLDVTLILGQHEVPETGRSGKSISEKASLLRAKGMYPQGMLYITTIHRQGCATRTFDLFCGSHFDKEDLMERLNDALIKQNLPPLGAEETPRLSITHGWFKREFSDLKALDRAINNFRLQSDTDFDIKHIAAVDVYLHSVNDLTPPCTTASTVDDRLPADYISNPVIEQPSFPPGISRNRVEHSSPPTDPSKPSLGTYGIDTTIGEISRSPTPVSTPVSDSSATLSRAPIPDARTYLHELSSSTGNTTASIRLLRIIRDQGVDLDSNLGLKLLDLAKALRLDGELSPHPPSPAPAKKEPIEDRLNDFAGMLNAIAEAVGVELLDENGGAVSTFGVDMPAGVATVANSTTVDGSPLSTTSPRPTAPPQQAALPSPAPTVAELADVNRLVRNAVEGLHASVHEGASPRPTLRELYESTMPPSTGQNEVRVVPEWYLGSALSRPWARGAQSADSQKSLEVLERSHDADGFEDASSSAARVNQERMGSFTQTADVTSSLAAAHIRRHFHNAPHIPGPNAQDPSPNYVSGRSHHLDMARSQLDQLDYLAQLQRRFPHHRPSYDPSVASSHIWRPAPAGCTGYEGHLQAYPPLFASQTAHPAFVGSSTHPFTWPSSVVPPHIDPRLAFSSFRSNWE